MTEMKNDSEHLEQVDQTEQQAATPSDENPYEALYQRLLPDVKPLLDEEIRGL